MASRQHEGSSALEAVGARTGTSIPLDSIALVNETGLPYMQMNETLQQSQNSCIRNSMKRSRRVSLSWEPFSIAVSLLQLFPLHGSQDLSPVLSISELQEPYALPCTSIKPAIGNGDANACSDQGALDMCLLNHCQHSPQISPHLAPGKVAL